MKASDNQMKIIPEDLRHASPLKLMLVDVTPKLAKKLLERNSKNRNPREANITNLAMQMEAGEWNPYNGEAIKVDSRGRLADGQHRLMAVIKANITVPIHFIFNCHEETLNTVDGGVARSATDILKLNDISYADKLPAIIRYQKLAIRGVRPDTSGRDTGCNLSNAEILRIAKEEESFLITIAKQSQTWYHQFNFILGPTVIAKFYNVFARIDRNLAYEFMNSLCTNVFLEDKDPIKILKDMLIANKVSALKKLSADEKQRAIILTWNNWLEGKKYSKLSLSTTDGWPKIKGVDNVSKFDFEYMPIHLQELREKEKETKMREAEAQLEQEQIKFEEQE